MAAAGNEDENNVVARFEVDDAGARLDHHAGGLVAEHHRRRTRPRPVDHRQVGMTKAGGFDLHKHFAVARRVKLKGLDL